MMPSDDSDQITRITGELNLSESVVSVAREIFEQAREDNLIQGWSIEGIAGGSLFAACRLNDAPMTLADIAGVSRVDKSEIGRSFSYLSQELGLETKPIPPEPFVYRICSELNLSDRVRDQANQIIDRAREKDQLHGVASNGHAASAVYIAARRLNEKKTQREIANVVNVTPVTLRKRYKEQVELI